MRTVGINLNVAHCARRVLKRIIGLVHSPIHNGFRILVVLSTSNRTAGINEARGKIRFFSALSNETALKTKQLSLLLACNGMYNGIKRSCQADKNFCPIGELLYMHLRYLKAI